jgi:fucose 4-O-acetylase-like acetyltransferase
MATSLSAALEPLAAWFRSFGIPEPITHWGHPAMMAIVAIFMGGFAAYSGWQSRVTTDETVKLKMKADHRKVAPLMALFLAMGYTGGVLSLVMQEKPILESPHFWTGSLVLVLLAVQALVSGFGFANDKGTLRSLHAYVGSALIGILVIHGILGLNLGLSI